MKIYINVMVQHTDRSAYMVRQFRKWVRRSSCFVGLLLDATLGLSVLTSLLLGCMADGMDETVFVMRLTACIAVAGVSAMARTALRKAC